MKQFLVEKYRPSNLDGYIFQSDENERKIRKWIESKDVPNLLITGGPGCGKSTLSRIIVNELDVDPSDVKYVNASVESGIGFIREELTPWLKKASFGDVKIVQLEEADRLSIDAQKALRQISEDYSDRVRFIATANYPKKIDPAIHSRFQRLEMEDMNQDALINFVVDIMEKEQIHIKHENDLLEIIDRFSPDVRKIINTIDECTDSDNVLHRMSDLDSGGDIEQWSNYWETVDTVSVDDLLQMTPMVDGGNFEFFYETMYSNHDKLPDTPTGIILISKYLDRAYRCANQKLHLEACIYHIFLQGDSDE